MAPWGARGLYKAPAIEHKACPPTMGGEPSRAIKHPAVIGLVYSVVESCSPGAIQLAFYPLLVEIPPL